MANANSTSTPTLASVIQMAIDSRMRNTGVALPGTVVSYNADTGLCAVKPGVHRLVPSREEDGEDEVEELPTLQGVPVCWLVGRGIQVKGGLNKGDSVLLVCLDRDADGWFDTGAPSEPGDARNHSWNNAVAIPGLVPATSPFPEPGDAAALASKLDFLIAAILSVVPAPVAGVDAGEPGLTALQLKLSAPPPTGMGAAAPGFTTGSSVLLLDS